MSEELFSPEFFAALAAVARRRARQTGGAAAQPGAGSAERGFERRAWRAGDDRRAVDSRASARRSQLLVRERHPQRGGSLLIWLDRSASLAPAGPARDWAQRRLALAAGWLALERGALVRARAGDAPERLFAGSARRQALRAWLAGLPDPRGGDVAPRLGSRDPNCEILLLTDPWLQPECLALSARRRRSAAAARAVILVLAEEDAPPRAALRLHEAESGGRLLVDLAEGAAWLPVWSAWLDGARARLRRCGFEAHDLRCGSAAALIREGERCGVL